MIVANIEGAAAAILLATPAVVSLVGGRIRALNLAQGDALPGIRLQDLDDQTTQTLEAYAPGDEADGISLLQVGVAAATVGEVRQLEALVQAALEAFEGVAGGIRWDSATAGRKRWNPLKRNPGSDRGTFERIMEFTVFYSGV